MLRPLRRAALIGGGTVIASTRSRTAARADAARFAADWAGLPNRRALR